MVPNNLVVLVKSLNFMGVMVYSSFLDLNIPPWGLIWKDFWSLVICFSCCISTSSKNRLWFLLGVGGSFFLGLMKVDFPLPLGKLSTILFL